MEAGAHHAQGSVTAAAPWQEVAAPVPGGAQGQLHAWEQSGIPVTQVPHIRPERAKDKSSHPT